MTAAQYPVGTVLTLRRDDGLDGDVKRTVRAPDPGHGETDKYVWLDHRLITEAGNAWSTSSLLFALDRGWSVVSVEEPEPELPTEPGLYQGNGQTGGFWQLDSDGGWWFRGYRNGYHPTLHDQGRSENDARIYGAPFTRLRPESEVRAEVVEEIAKWLAGLEWRDMAAAVRTFALKEELK